MAVKITVHTRDAERWITIKHGEIEGSGQHVKIDGNGNVVAGMGGKKMKLEKAAPSKQSAEQPTQQPTQRTEPTSPQPSAAPPASTPAAKRAKKEPEFEMVMPPVWLNPRNLRRYTLDLRKQPIHHVERNIRNNTFETAAIYGQDGKVIDVVSQGIANAVQLDERLIGKMKDSVFTHNHPKGSSLGKADLLAAITADVAELRAVGTQYDYSIKRPAGGWPPSAAVLAAYDDVNNRLHNVYGPRVRAGEITAEEAWLSHSHEAMDGMAKKMNLEYTRKPAP